MFPRDLFVQYTVYSDYSEEGMSDKHNNKVAKEIENFPGWQRQKSRMQVIVQIVYLSGQKSWKHENIDTRFIFRFLSKIANSISGAEGSRLEAPVEIIGI